jgi:hypothetical protein
LDAYVGAWDELPEPSTFFVVLLPTENGLPNHVHVASLDGLTEEAAIQEALEAYAARHHLAIARWRAKDLRQRNGERPRGYSGPSQH